MGLLGNIFGKKSNLSRANTSSGYDWNNVYDIASAFACVCACAGDSSIFIPIQDRDDSKGWKECLIITVRIDADCGVSALNTKEEYRKLFVPEDVSSFLLDNEVTFKPGGSFLTYQYHYKPDTPTPTSDGFAQKFADALDRGCRKSEKVQMGLIHFRINVPNEGTVELRT